MTVLVTGANGFVGRAMCARLVSQGIQYRSVSRIKKSESIHFDPYFVPTIDADTEWKYALSDVEVVVHLAARVHVMRESSLDPLAEFRRVNVQGTVNLARQAVSAGAKRFIYVSSAKVNGEFTTVGHPFTADDLPAPADPYGISKFEAEQELLRISKETGLELVIVRSPLIYGPQVGGNFEIMMRWIHSEIPLPLGGISDNQRSFISLNNFVDLLQLCISHPDAANQIFMASDGQDLSTRELLDRLAFAMGKKSRLFSVPNSFLRLVAYLLDKEDVYLRLCGSLQVDIHKTKVLLSWSPPVSLEQGIKQTVTGFKN